MKHPQIRQRFTTNRNLVRATHTIVASAGVVTGVGLGHNHSHARARAEESAWTKLQELDAKHGTCSGIAVECGMVGFADGRLRYRWDAY